MSQIARPAVDEPAIDAQALKKAEEYIEAEEGASNKLRGWLGVFVTAVGGNVGVPSLHRIRDRAGAGAAPGARRLRAVPQLSAVSGREALPPPHHVVGLGGCG